MNVQRFEDFDRAVTASPPPSLPQGMSDVDYEAIEAAVTETVRGRWFLAEFARRNRGAEVKLMLDAMGRLETLVTTQAQPSLPPPSSDPSIRLMLQRIKEIAASLDTAAQTMRAADVAATYWQPVEQQARAVAGLMRGGALPDGAPVRATVAPPENRPAESPPVGAAKPAPPRLPRVGEHPVDPRLKIFSALDNLPLAQKLAAFT